MNYLIAPAAVFAATISISAPVDAATQVWVAEASEFNNLPLLCDGAISFDLVENAPNLKGRKAVVDYMVSQAAFGSGVEFPSDLDRVMVKQGGLSSTHLAVAFAAIYDILVTDGVQETTDIANSYQGVLDATFAAMEQDNDNGFYVYENAEAQGGNLEQLFIYDRNSLTFGRIELSCG